MNECILHVLKEKKWNFEYWKINFLLRKKTELSKWKKIFENESRQNFQQYPTIFFTLETHTIEITFSFCPFFYFILFY